MSDAWLPLGQIDHTVVTAIAVSPGYARDRTVFAASLAFLHVSQDGGDTWSAVAPGLLSPLIADVALSPGYEENGMLVVTSPAGLFRSADRGTTWEFVAECGPNALVRFVDDERFVAVSPSTVERSLGAVEPSPLAEVTLQATAPDGSRSFVPVEPSGIAYSGDGTTWTARSVPSGALVTSLDSDGHGLIATTIDGRSFRRAATGDDWRPVARIGGEGTLRRTAHNGRLLVRSDGTRLEHSRDSGATWTPSSPPIDTGDEIVDVAIAVGSQREEVVLAAGVRDANRVVSVWVLAGAEPWRLVISHPEPAGMVSLVLLGGPRRLFAAIGDSVYRPARIGAALFVREVVEPDRRPQVLQLHGVITGDGEPYLAVLTDLGLFTSDDSGFSWVQQAHPGSLPLIAIAVSDAPTARLVTAELGGAIYSRAIPEIAIGVPSLRMDLTTP